MQIRFGGSFTISDKTRLKLNPPGSAQSTTMAILRTLPEGAFQTGFGMNGFYTIGISNLYDKIVLKFFQDKGVLHKVHHVPNNDQAEKLYLEHEVKYLRKQLGQGDVFNPSQS